jgi:deaminated glutathione amidase
MSELYCGRSLVVDPMGVKLADGGEAARLVVTTIDTDRIGEVRAKLPSFRHRRPDLYVHTVAAGR